MIRPFLFALLLLCAYSAAPARADTAISMDSAGTPTLMLKQQTATHPEKILMAYNKVAGLRPDFLDWAKHSPFLKGAAAGDVDVIVNRESNRLSQAYSTMDAQDILVIHGKIYLDEYSTIREILHLSEFTPQTFFSYSLYGQNVAIIPKDIAAFADISVSKAKMDDMLAKAGGGQVMVELLLKPMVADAKTPFKSGGKDYWLLLTDIAEIRFWTNEKGNPQLLWMQRADWYKPKQNKELMDLKPGFGN